MVKKIQQSPQNIQSSIQSLTAKLHKNPMYHNKRYTARAAKWGMQWRSCLRIAGSIPDGVNAIFH